VWVWAVCYGVMVMGVLGLFFNSISSFVIRTHIFNYNKEATTNPAMDIVVTIVVAGTGEIGEGEGGGVKFGVLGPGHYH
jgi:hypothetical protein